MALRLLEYVDEDGINHFRRWFIGLDRLAAVRVQSTLARIQEGNTSSVKWFAGIGEARIDFGPGYRVYLAQEGKHLIILFAGGTKSGQRRDIDRAKLLRDEYKRRKE